MEKIKVFLSDPQVLFREGIHFTLSGEEDFEVIGETTSNEDAFAHIEASPPNVAILSMKDDKLDGTEVTRRIKRHIASVSMILIMDRDDEEQLFAAMKSGASACLNKDIDPQYLLDLIRMVAQGSQPIMEALLTPGLAARVLIEFEDLATLTEQLNNVLARLSAKEAEIVSAIAAGSGVEQVSAKLNITEETIRRHLNLILNKLVTNDQTRAVIEAAQRSLPSLISSKIVAGKPGVEYVTRVEFNEFKDSLMHRLKSFIGEMA